MNIVSMSTVKNIFVATLLALLAGPILAEDSIAVGKQLTFDRAKGNCLACHRIDDGELPGTLGPPLLAMKLRFPDEAQLKKQICDATIRQPNTRMPPFCPHGILTEEEVDLIVDYLYTL